MQFTIKRPFTQLVLLERVRMNKLVTIFELDERVLNGCLLREWVIKDYMYVKITNYGDRALSIVQQTSPVHYEIIKELARIQQIRFEEKLQIKEVDRLQSIVRNIETKNWYYWDDTLQESFITDLEEAKGSLSTLRSHLLLSLNSLATIAKKIGITLPNSSRFGKIQGTFDYRIIDEENGSTRYELVNK